MSPKCVYGEHEMHPTPHPCPSGQGWPCEPEPEPAFAGAGTIDFGGVEDPDFASLLEREPSDASDSIEDWMQKCEDAAKRNLTLRAAVDSQAARIKELEGVLVAVRAGVDASRRMQPTGIKSLMAKANERLDGVTKLINETLDPCKPWCVLEPGHGGACTSDVEFCEDRDE